ncbi:hypothetical protein [Pseudomonas fulva]|uniref:hypothetical protein n=1 Tax=Pseudomonas fulva TaxID=47880 RepID=UPI001E52E9FA|nr:hypothetical protein [Pseudomonas fulva]MEB8059343.1 hypothetical protein [Pseudomonas fulva]
MGQFFDIGVDGMRLRIEVASEALHYGVVRITGGKMASEGELSGQTLSLPSSLLWRNWNAFKWYSCLYQDNVDSGMEGLSDAGRLVREVLRVVELIRSGGVDRSGLQLEGALS